MENSFTQNKSIFNAHEVNANCTMPKGLITVKQAKNHVKRLKNYQVFQTYLCNATLMSC
jgi:hypothetical protein